MKFFKGLWEHERFMDVFIEVVKVRYQDEKRARLKIIWWNKGWTGNPMPISPIEKLHITDFNGWKQCKNPFRKVRDCG